LPAVQRTSNALPSRLEVRHELGTSNVFVSTGFAVVWERLFVNVVLQYSLPPAARIEAVAAEGASNDARICTEVRE
jgi:hypothetical protein